MDYIKTMDAEPDIDDKEVWDINREKAFLAPERIRLVTEYILTHFDQKTYRVINLYIQRIAEYRRGCLCRQQAADRGNQAEAAGQRVQLHLCRVQRGCCKALLRRVSEANGGKSTEAAEGCVIYSYGANEEETDGILDEENPEDTSALDQSSRDFLDAAIRDYNGMFHTNYSTDGDKFQNYYKDVSLRMKNKELDLLIVVNMFLTGFDATTLNTLWWIKT